MNMPHITNLTYNSKQNKFRCNISNNTLLNIYDSFLLVKLLMLVKYNPPQNLK